MSPPAGPGRLTPPALLRSLEAPARRELGAAALRPTASGGADRPTRAALLRSPDALAPASLAQALAEPAQLRYLRASDRCELGAGAPEPTASAGPDRKS